MSVNFAAGSAPICDRNGESPFVDNEAFAASNFSRFYAATGATQQVEHEVVVASVIGTIEAMVMHYWVERDYRVKLHEHIPGMAALYDLHPEWKTELIGLYGIGVDPAATVRLYTSESEVVVRRVFRDRSVQQDGSLFPSGLSYPPGLTREGFGRPPSMAATDEAGEATKCLFRLFERPSSIPGLDYESFIGTNFSEWMGNVPLRFFERKPFYKALNAALAQDAPNILHNAMPLIQDMNWYLNETRHIGGLLFSGVGLGSSCKHAQSRVGKRLRMPRFLSATTNENLARAHLKHKVGPALLKIHVPEGFQGARYIESITANPGELETLFCAYSLFLVLSTSVSDLFVPPVMTIELQALDKYGDICYALYPSLPQSGAAEAHGDNDSTLLE